MRRAMDVVAVLILLFLVLWMFTRPQTRSAAPGFTAIPTQIPPTAAALAPIGAQPGGLSAAMQPVATVDPDIGKTLDAHLQSLAAKGLFNGAVLVAYRGELLLNKGYGMANYELGVPATPQTRFRLASVTKQFTAVGVLMLAAQGKIAVQDSICKYLSDCPVAWQPVTVHHLLSHTSGVPNYTDFLDYADFEQTQATPQQIISRFRDLPLSFAPGTSFYYGNSNYVLLGMIIEQVTGETYADWMRVNIFQPLGMSDTGYDPGAGMPLSGTRGYVAPGKPAIPINTSTLFSAGGLYSTVGDLYIWDQALNTDTLLDAKWRTLMFTPVMQQFGYGWKISDDRGHRRIGHAGLMSGASTYIGRYPDDGLTVIVLSNQETVDAPGIAIYLAQLVMP